MLTVTNNEKVTSENKSGEISKLTQMVQIPLLGRTGFLITTTCNEDLPNLLEQIRSVQQDKDQQLTEDKLTHKHKKK